jgi:hypothetical protein
MRHMFVAWLKSLDLARAAKDGLCALPVGATITLRLHKISQRRYMLLSLISRGICQVDECDRALLRYSDTEPTPGLAML